MMERRRWAAALSMLAFLWIPGYGAEENDEIVVVKAGLVIPVEGDAIKKGVIVIRNGRIEAVGKNVEYPREAEVVDAPDSVVMPGLVNPCSWLGRKEFRRTGVRANLKVADEFSLDPDLHKKLLQAGFTTLGLVPPGTGFPGQALAFKPLGEKREDWTLNESAYILVTHTDPSKEKDGFRKAMETAQKEIEKVEKARKEWEEKQKKKAEEEKEKKEGEKEEKKEDPEKKDRPEEKGKGEKEKEKKEEKKEDVFTPPPINPAYKPLVDLIQKKEDVRALVSLDQASDYVHFKEALDERDILCHYVLYTQMYPGRTFSSDFIRVASELGEEKASVVIHAVINFKPYTTHRVNLAAELHRKGCEVSLIPATSTLEEHAALLKRVAFLVKCGLEREAALKAVTLNPARVMGLEDRVGSLAKGKDGNLLFLSDDPFSPLSRLEKVMIEGKIVAEGPDIQ